MANRKFGAVALLGAALLILGAGCGGSDPSEAETPANAQTVTNGAPADSGGEQPSGGEVDPAVAAGKTVFEGSCQGCHPAGGTEAGVGPSLAASTLDEAGVSAQIENGGGAMPGGLATGEDLENVVAYVMSLRQ